MEKSSKEKVKMRILTKPLSLTQNEVNSFNVNGYLKLENRIEEIEVEKIKQVILNLYNRFDKLPKSLARDLEEQNKVRKNPEVERCLFLAPSLSKTNYIKSISSIAKQLLGNDCSLCYDHAIMKMPNSQAPTRWHQDEAYELKANNNADLAARHRISFWLPLQNVNKEMGCMQFLPTSFKSSRLLPHYSVISGGHVLTTNMSNQDLSTVDICELNKGGFTIHGGRTPHFAGGNCTDQFRFAWIVSFMKEAKPYYSWFTHIKNYLH